MCERDGVEHVSTKLKEERLKKPHDAKEVFEILRRHSSFSPHKYITTNVRCNDVTKTPI